MSSVTPIRPGSDVPAPPSFPETVQATLREHLGKIGEAMATVQLSAATIRTVYDCDHIESLPIDRALRGAARMLEEVFAEFLKLEEQAESELKAGRP